MKLIRENKQRISTRFKMLTAAILAGLLLLLFLCTFWTYPIKPDVITLAKSKELQPPVTSASGGFYAAPFAVQLTAPTPGTVIYYTLDGSEPTLLSPVYKHPVVINVKEEENVLSAIPTSPRWAPPVGDVFKGTVLRAIAVKDFAKSKELMKTFFVDPKGTARYSLPVVSLVVDYKDFFGYNKGIYVLGKSYGDKDNYIRKNISLDLPWWEYPSNYLDRGNDAERDAHIELYEPGGKAGFEANVGVRINGNATRGYAQKSLRINFREKYGTASLDYPLFPGYPVHTFNSFILRNSGNDWDKTMFRDGLIQSLMKDAHVDIQADRSAIVFINGEYWGIHNIRERFDENYLANKYHMAADSLCILELNGVLSHGKKGDTESFKELLEFVQKHDLSQQQNYEELTSKIDIQSFIDFLAVNIYFCNSDWPNNNVKFWHYKTPEPTDTAGCRDGRWRWMLYDTDWGFGYNTASVPSVNLLEKAKRTGSVGILFSALIKNKSFVEAFTQRFQYLIDHQFSTKHLISEVDRMQGLMAPEMREHINRWRVIGTYGQWLDNVEVLRDFAKKRPQLQADQLNAFFKLTESNRIIVKN
ncbi:MAG: hypothetical protein JWP12_223 [Bacteroidetes bacterium]|nr:hypothetical protein [Bacteroidota bacterium]